MTSPAPSPRPSLALIATAGAAGSAVLALGVGIAAGALAGVLTGVTAALLAGRVVARAEAAAAARLADAERTLARARAQLASAEHLATFGALGAGITHEVKNPVTTLVGFAQLAQRRIDERDKVMELLRIIEAEGLRCRDILTSYLGFARAGGASAEPVDVNALVEDTARLTRHQLVIHGLELELALAEGAPAVLGSRRELQQVLVNLVLNAQQATRAPGKVRVSTAVRGGGVEIAVADDGPGVPVELRERIFEPFFTTKPEGEGTGLGLSLSADIARAHGGTLRLDPPGARGASFTLALPAAPATVAGAPPASARATGAQGSEAQGTAAQGAGEHGAGEPAQGSGRASAARRAGRGPRAGRHR